MTSRLKSLQIIHFALCIGPSLFGAFAILQNGENSTLEVDQNSQLLIIIATILSLTLVILSGIIPNRTWGSIKKKDAIEDKFNKYRAGSIMQWAILEGGVFLNFVFYLLYANYYFLFIGLFLLALLFLKRPTFYRAIQITKTTESEFES